MVRHFIIGRHQEEAYLHTNLLATILALLFMLYDGLVMAAVNVRSDYSIQCDSYAQERKQLVQESPKTSKVSSGLVVVPTPYSNKEREKGKRCERGDLPIRHNNSAILKRLLDSIVPHGLVLPMSQSRKPLIQVTAQERQQRDRRQQDIADETGNDCSKRSSEDESNSDFEHIVSESKIAKVVPGAAQCFAGRGRGG